MRGALFLLGLMLHAACAGHQATGRVVEGAGALTVKWQRLSPLQQHFILGYTQTEQGRFAEALTHLQQVRGHYPLLDDYVLYTTARAALGAGQFDAARTAASTLKQLSDSRLATRADDLLIDVAIRSQQWGEAESRILAAMHTTRSPWARREGLAQLARLDLARGQPQSSGQRYLELYRTAQYPDHIAVAKRGLRQVSLTGGGPVIRSLPDHERYAMAREFLARGLSAEAARLLADIGGVSRRELADAYFRAREYAKATDLYAPLAQLRFADIALLESYATAAARAGRDTTAIAMQEAIIARGAPAANVQRARAKRAFLLLDHGDYAQAATAYHDWLSAARGTASRDEIHNALWAIAWAEYRQRHADAALAALSELAAHVGSDRLWQARIAYWQGRIYESARRMKEAHAQFTHVVHHYSGSYYGRLALARLQGKNASAKLFLLPASTPRAQQPVGLPVDDLSPKAVELVQLGLWEAAVEEVEHRHGAHPPLLPVHDAAVAHYAAMWGLDAHLVRRLMWQESANRPQVVSPVGAIGLLQLMPSTALAMARELQLPDFRTADLFRPLPNLRLGMWYLRTLKERYQGKLPLMLASYNAGEAAVDRWRAQRSDHDMEEYIETIPYSETRNYVRRILQMYW